MRSLHPTLMVGSAWSTAVALCLLLLTTLARSPALAEPPSDGRPPGDRPVVFTDVTAQAGIDFVETIGDHKMSNIVEATGVGCGFLDYDGDGRLDLYLVNGCWLKEISDPGLKPRERDRLAAATDRLYRNRGGGKFEDVTARAGLATPAYGMAVVVADYDGDADPDLYVTNFGANCLYRNNGDGTFTDLADQAGVADPQFSVGAVFLDDDRDGRLDLYVGNYLHYDPEVQRRAPRDEVVCPLEYRGQQDHLFRGREDGTFSEVTRQAGLEIKPVGRAMGVGAFDYDNDGWTDVFVSNDAMENYLLHNQADGTFENVALLAGVAFGGGGDARAAMAVETGDYDGDGFLDLMIPDMHFCCLYRNVGGEFFDDLTGPSGIASVMSPYHAWGGLLADFDLDGDLDLFICTGDARRLEAYPDRIFVNEGKGRFADASDTAGDYLRARFVSRGVARGDFDNDGDLDLLVNHLNDRPALLRNDTPRRGRHWLGVRLVGRPPNTDALGAVVEVRAGELSMVRQRNSAGSYLSQHDPRLHFGLGPHAKVDLLEVTWPNGQKQVLKDVPADQYMTIHREGQGVGAGKVGSALTDREAK